MIKHVQILMEKKDYIQLRKLCALRGCTQQALLLEVICKHLQDAPELKALGKEK